MEQHKVRVMMLGDANCGKSIFLSSISQGLHATRLEDGKIVISRPDRRYLVRIDENNIKSPSPDEAVMVILCYDIGNPRSLEVAQQYWHTELSRKKPTELEKVPAMLLGLKRDLRNGDPSATVDVNHALKVAGEMRLAIYAECSAKTGELMKQVAEDFLKTLRAAVDLQSAGDTYSYCIVS